MNNCKKHEWQCHVSSEAVHVDHLDCTWIDSSRGEVTTLNLVEGVFLVFLDATCSCKKKQGTQQEKKQTSKSLERKHN